MEPDHTDTTDGSLTTLDGRFLSRQQIRAAGERVTRLLVSDSTDTDDGTPTAVLASGAHRGELLGLRTGHRYRFTDVRWCVPPPGLDRATNPDGATADSDGTPMDCPTCGGTLRVAGTYDDLPAAVGAAAERLALTEPFAVLTDSTTVRAANADLVDDWRGSGTRAPPRSEHERGSISLRVPRAFVDDLVALRTSLASELEAQGDETLTQELDVLDVLDALLDAADIDPSTVEQEGTE